MGPCLFFFLSFFKPTIVLRSVFLLEKVTAGPTLHSLLLPSITTITPWPTLICNEGSFVFPLSYKRRPQRSLLPHTFFEMPPRPCQCPDQVAPLFCALGHPGGEERTDSICPDPIPVWSPQARWMFHKTTLGDSICSTASPAPYPIPAQWPCTAHPSAQGHPWCEYEHLSWDTLHHNRSPPLNLYS